MPNNGINSSASKRVLPGCFVTAIFAHILRLIIQNRFHLLLKVLLQLPTPITDSKKDRKITKHFDHGWETAFSQMLPEN